MVTQTQANTCSPPPDHGEIILRTVGLTKEYGKLTAVKNLNLELRRVVKSSDSWAERAGKSTTVGMILGLVAATSGKIELFGRDFNDNRWASLRRVGAVIEEPAFYPYLSGWDNLEALSKAIGGIQRTKITEVLERVKLLDRAKR